ncbi:hypothetical protein Tco_0597853 [Tanacetum coccineum]
MVWQLRPCLDGFHFTPLESTFGHIEEENCLDAATVVNKEAAAHSMVSKQSLQHTFHVPSLATYDSAELRVLIKVSAELLESNYIVNISSEKADVAHLRYLLQCS